MRAALLAQYREDFTLGEVPEPTITSPNDVIVRVGAAGFCRMIGRGVLVPNER